MKWRLTIPLLPGVISELTYNPNMEENIYGVSDEVLEHYRKMNWKVRQAMLNTSVTLGLGPDFVKKVIETCYHGKYPGTQEESDRQIVWDHMKWNSRAAARTYRCWLQSLTEEERRMQSLKGDQE